LTPTKLLLGDYYIEFCSFIPHVCLLIATLETERLFDQVVLVGNLSDRFFCYLR